MRLSDENIKEFQAIYKRNFGIDLTKEDAYEKGVKLLRLLSLTYKPMTERNFQMIQKHREATKSVLERSLNTPHIS